VTTDDRSDWQRRYDESIERERQKWEEQPDSVTSGELVAIEGAGTCLTCLPVWMTVIAAAFGGLGALIFWLRKRLRT
jgi:hypothetical protein